MKKVKMRKFLKYVFTLIKVGKLIISGWAPLKKIVRGISEKFVHTEIILILKHPRQMLLKNFCFIKLADVYYVNLTKYSYNTIIHEA